MGEIWSGLVVLFIFLMVFALVGLAVFIICSSLKRSIGIRGKLSTVMDQAKEREKEILLAELLRAKPLNGEN